VRPLFSQLQQVQWAIDSDGTLRVHKLGRSGLGRSPDLADAFALAVEARRLVGPPPAAPQP
jgi:hypothetical protein